MVSSKHLGWAMACLLIVGAATTATAQQRYFVGARNLGMGSTGVGGTIDAMAGHFNPAGKAFSESWELQLPLITADATLDGEILSSIDRLSDNFNFSSLDEIQSRLNNGTATAEDLQSVLDAFLYDLSSLDGSDDGANVRGIVGPSFRWKNWGGSVSFLGNGDVQATIDLNAGLALSALGSAGLPAPPSNASGSDPFCLGFAQQLIDESSGQLGQDRAEQLVDLAGPEFQNNQQAQDILASIVQATAQGDELIANNKSAAITASFLVQQFTATYSRKIWRDKLSVGGNFRS